MEKKRNGAKLSVPLIVFFRGINVGGHRRFRPSVLAKELEAYDVLNVGAAGTLIVRKPGSRAKFLAALRRQVPFEVEVALCDGGDLLRLEMENPFGSEPPRQDLVRFVSILSTVARGKASLPIALPEGGEWFVRIIGTKDRLVYGVYRRLSWSDRRSFWFTGDNKELEHDIVGGEDFETIRADNDGMSPTSADQIFD